MPSQVRLFTLEVTWIQTYKVAKCLHTVTQNEELWNINQISKFLSKFVKTMLKVLIYGQAFSYCSMRFFSLWLWRQNRKKWEPKQIETNFSVRNVTELSCNKGCKFKVSKPIDQSVSKIISEMLFPMLSDTNDGFCREHMNKG